MALQLRLVLGVALLNCIIKPSCATALGGQCNTTFSNANGTGVFPFTVNWTTAQFGDTYQPFNSHPIPQQAWAVTVAERDGKAKTDYWLDTAGQRYWQDLRNQFDACAFIYAGGIPEKTLEAGQDDPGDCSSMLSSGCRHALLSIATDRAATIGWFASSPPHSNISAGVMPELCYDIFKSLAFAGEGDFPSECNEDFSGYNGLNGVSPIGLALTGNNISSSAVDPYCAVNGDGQTFQRVIGGGNFVEYDYNRSTRYTTPILTVYFSVDYETTESYASGASSDLRCVRVTNFTEGSRVSPRLPPGNPYPRRNNNTATIAGVVAGVAAFVIVIAALTVYYLFRRRRRQRRSKDELVKKEKEMQEHSSGVYELDDKSVRPELSPTDRKAEVEGYQIEEVGSSEVPAVEVDAFKDFNMVHVNISTTTISTYDTCRTL